MNYPKSVMYLAVSYSYGNNINTRLFDARETKTRIIDNGPIEANYRKCNEKEYIAYSNDNIWAKEYVYPLDSDFAIKTLGAEILKVNHHNSEYIKTRYEQLEYIKKVSDTLKRINDTLDYETAVKIAGILNI